MEVRLQTIVEVPEFIRRAKAAGMTEADRNSVIDELAANPEAGIPLGGGLRKARVARAGGGKSGGFRIIHFYRENGLPLFLLTVFAKNEKANITPVEKDNLVALCDQIARTYRRPK